MKDRIHPTRRRVLQGIAGAAALSAVPRYAHAQQGPVKIGLILPMTGPFASTGKQVSAACRLYMQKNGDTIAGRKVELIVKDDTGLAPETSGGLPASSRISASTYSSFRSAGQPL